MRVSLLNKSAYLVWGSDALLITSRPGALSHTELVLSVQQCVCSVQQLNVTQSECATFAQLDYPAVLLTAGGDDCQFCVWDVRTFDCGPHTKDKRWDSIPAIASNGLLHAW